MTFHSQNKGKTFTVAQDFVSRWIYVHLLAPTGKTEWRWVLWGKESLDRVRHEGYSIIGTYDSQPY